ncbi:MAG: hypothetical protein IT335_11550, partial [Thermomicrobiales bacterium]|nr:hypothetical protein [Thermomicrobiales bacterium]
MEPEPSVVHIIEVRQVRSEPYDAIFLDVVTGFFTPARIPNRRPEIGAEYERCLQQESSSADGHDTARCGALGFYLFCSFAERWGKTNDDADREQADEFLSDKRVRSFLFDLYGIEDTFRHTDLVLHASGTTSFIIKTHYFQNAYHRVVKIIKPWFLSDPIIAAQTEGSKEFYDQRLAHVTFRTHPTAQPLPIAPIVEFANRHCVIMEYVEGETLKQYFTRLWARPEGEGTESGEDPYVALNRLVQSLCGMMKACHQASIAHGDLSS